MIRHQTYCNPVLVSKTELAKKAYIKNNNIFIFIFTIFSIFTFAFAPNLTSLYIDVNL